MRFLVVRGRQQNKQLTSLEQNEKETCGTYELDEVSQERADCRKDIEAEEACNGNVEVLWPDGRPRISWLFLIERSVRHHGWEYRQGDKEDEEDIPQLYPALQNVSL